MSSSEHHFASAQQLARFLDRVRVAYPNGIPHGALRMAASVPSTDTDKDITTVLFVVFSQSLVIPPEHEVLLDSVISKGLKIGPERAFRCVVGNDSEYLAATEKYLSLHASGVVIVLGGPRQDGDLEVLGQNVILHSHTLTAIAGDAKVKKLFWGHLQKVLGRLA